MFTKPFDTFACSGDTITCEVDDFKVTATIHDDDDTTPPWEREEGHGPVSDWTTRAQNPGERVLNQNRDSFRYYDFNAAVEIAKRDGWDEPPYGEGTPDERAVRAVEADFKALKAWCNDEWRYVGIAVTVSKADVELTGEYDHAVWGIDCNHPNGNNAYLMEVANELLGPAIEAANEKLEELAAPRP